MAAARLKVRLRRYAPRPNHWTLTPEGREKWLQAVKVGIENSLKNHTARKAARIEQSMQFRLALVALAEQFPEHRAELLRVFGS